MQADSDLSMRLAKLTALELSALGLPGLTLRVVGIRPGSALIG